VQGLAASIPLDRENPFAPANRRISIVVLNKATGAAFTTDTHTLQVENAAQLERGPDAPLLPPSAPTAAPAQR
jgi:chemotaxis protein MotB